MGSLEGKVAFITGAARGQGRNHAVRLAERGVDVIALDLNDSISTVPYDGATDEDLAETVRQVEGHGRRILAHKADTRDLDAVRSIIDAGVAELGRLDIVIPNAGIASFDPAREMSDQTFKDVIDINLLGVWHTVHASLPHLKADGTGGAIVLTGSVASFKGIPNLVHYVAAKHGLVGMAKTLAAELGPERIRVNVVCPGNIDTEMVVNQATLGIFMPELEHPTRADAEKPGSAYYGANVIPIPWLEVDDITNAILFLVSDEARYITGVALPVDAGYLLK
jgi:SDR family mycofactocin-dependent oxidoreductase